MVHDVEAGAAVYRLPFLREYPKVILIALAYFFAHQIAFIFPDSERVIMLVWPAGGVGLAAFLMNPRRLWPALALAFFAAGVSADVFLAGRSLMSGVGYMTGNLVESMSGAWLVLGLTKKFRHHRHVTEVLALFAVAFFVNALSSCIGAGTSVLVRGASFLDAWRSWYVADGLGILLMGPFIISWASHVKASLARLGRNTILEGLACLIVWSLLCAWVFYPGGHGALHVHPYILVAALAWPAMRLGMRGTTLVLVLLFAMALVSPSIVTGPSPWAAPNDSPQDRLLDLQLFLAFLAVVGYLLVASHADAHDREKAAAASEAQFRSLIESAPEAIFVQNDGRLLYLNPATVRLLGASRAEELLGAAIMEHIAPEYHPIVRDRIRFQRETGNPTPLRDMEYVRLDGSRVPVETMAVMTTYQGRDAHLVFVRDISERKLAEAALRDSERRYRAIYDNISIGVATIGPNMEILSLNRRMREWFPNVDPEQHPICHRVFNVPPRDEICTDCTTCKTLKDGQLHEAVTETPTPDGIRHYRIVSTPLTDAGGKVIAAIEMVDDITDRLRAEAALREAGQLNQEIIASAQEGVIVYDTDLRYKVWNPFMEAMTGVPAKDVLGRRPEEVFPFLREAGVIDVLEKALRGEGPVSTDIEFHVPEMGRSGWSSSTSGPLRDAEGKIVGVIATVRDITERKELELRFLQAQKMEAIGQLAGGVAHDFRNQLTVIQGFSEMLLRRPLITGEERSMVELILKAAERSATTTGQLLAYSRREILRPTRVSVSGCFHGIGSILRHMLGDDIRMVIRLGDEDDHAWIDAHLFQQAVLNLATNARDAMPTGGMLAIWTACVTLGPESRAIDPELPEGQYVVVTVSDTGSGMDELTLARVFDPFFTTKDVGKGTGMGLPMVYGFVKQSGGAIAIQSKRGRGTTVLLYFPRDGRACVDEPRGAPTFPGGRETVLLVEDEDEVRSMTITLLQEAGYRVLEAANGEDALAMIGRCDAAVDLLVTDIVMPGKTGVALAEQFLARYPGLGVLYLSGYPGEELIRRGMPDSLDHLPKPFTAEALLVRVRRALDNRKATLEK